MAKIKLSVEVLESRQMLAADPLITEFMASNATTLTDGNGATPDWIEIYNNGDQTLDLAGYRLTDDPADMNKWVFPSQNLAAGEYLIVFASGDGTPDPAGNLHTNFALSAAGEYLAMTDPSGNIVSEFNPGGADYPAQIQDISFGVGFDSASSNPLTPNSAARYVDFAPGDSQPSFENTWTTTGFNDAAWQSGSASVGYENSPADYAGLIQTAVPTGTTSVYIRIPFTVTDAQSVLSTLQMKYDDGFIAYINGTKVASANAPAIGSYNSTATGEHPDGLAVNYVDFDVSAFAGSVNVGTNILAIHSINRSSNSSDLLSVPNLLMSSGGPVEPIITGELLSPTPGLPNSNLRATDVQFSRVGGAFTGTFQLTLTSSGANESIRYTTNGTQPTASSSLYTGPFTVSNTTQIRARAYGPSGETGYVFSQAYSRADNITEAFSSDLPIVVLENFQQGVPGTGTGNFQTATLSLYEQDTSGRANLSNGADLSTRIGMRRRGSSTAGNPKTNLRIEIRDEDDQDKSVSLLGMPAESDWILYAPYNFDRAMLRNTSIYDFSDQMGNYAIRTRFVEVYSNTDDATLDSGDYMGVYVLMENIKRDNNRVDIAELSPNDNTGIDLTGGYIIKIDRPDGAADGAWHTSRGTPSIYNENSFVHVEPERADMTQEQVDYIRGYIEDFEDVLYGPNFTDPVVGYRAYFDVEASIDHHIMRTLSKDPDALRLSEYLHKDKDGKLSFGPLWDFDRSAGPDDDGRAANPVGWDANEAEFFGYDWWGRMFDDPSFMQQWVDRWQELRSTTLSDSNIAATINAQAAEIAEAQVRNFQRWSNIAPNGGTYSQPGLTGWEAEVSHLIGWLHTRAQWMDEQMVSAPSVTPPSGNVSPGTQVTLTSNQSGAAIYYTLDGSDPLLPNGTVSPTALVYGGPFTVSQDTVVNSRAFGSPGTSATSNSSYPANESPNDGLDGNTGTKYLNFGEENSGLIVTPNSGSSVLRSMRLTTANDAEERDPTSWEIYGTNDAITSADNSTGLAENWTLIDAGNINLPSARETNGPLISVGNSTAYTSYKIMFPTVKNPGAANSMQIADIRLYQTTNGTGGQIQSAFDDARAVHADFGNGGDGLSGWSQLVSRVYSTEVPADASSLRITELHFHPADPTAFELAQLPGASDDDFEFVELQNVSNSTISLIGVVFNDGVTFDFTNGSITSLAPGETVLLVENIPSFEVRYGTGLPVAGQYSGKFSNGGESVAAVDSSNQSIHAFTYDDAAPWPEAADGDGPSMKVVNVFGDYSDPANWQVCDTIGGTPGFVSDAITGDFDGDGDLDCDDINALSAESASGNHTTTFDVTGDGFVDSQDVHFWITDLRGTLLGDANLDGFVDVSDLNIWSANKFTTNSDWCSGDFNGDGIVDVSDLNLWNGNKFQTAQRPVAATRTESESTTDALAPSQIDANRPGVVAQPDSAALYQQFETTFDRQVQAIDGLFASLWQEDDGAESESSSVINALADVDFKSHF